MSEEYAVIEKDIVVTVTGNTAKANTQLYLYLGDKDIQVNIKIVDTKLQIKNGDGNLLALEEAGYCKILLRKPSGEFVRRQRLPIKEGKIILLIDETMCDELNEVGDITVQIRLYSADADTSPRWTTPPFTGIKVLNPIGDFDGEEVGVMLTDYGTCAYSNEDVVITDENGLYVPTNWRIGDVVSAIRLNKMETGIASSSSVSHNLASTQYFNTLAEMKAYPTEKLVNGVITYVVETNKRYEYFLGNTIDATTGKWREYLKGIQEIIDDYSYIEPVISSFYSTPTATTYEIGTVIQSPITFNWGVNKTVNTQTLTDCTIANNIIRTANYNNFILSDKTFTLSINDGKKTITKSISFNFRHYRYWGVATEPTVYNGAFIKSLSLKEFATNRLKSSFSVTADEDEYIYYCYPTSWGEAIFNVGGFDGGFTLVDTIEFLNDSGEATQFNIYKSENINLGTQTIIVK